jgi:ElaB/YqjD/DUF883 family membrane-anchored ribosome-binding protein
MNSEASATPDDARERLSASLKHMVDEAEHLLSKAQRSGNQEFDAARDKFEMCLRQARAELALLQDGAVLRAKQAARATDLAVHEHPYAAMGMAAGVGVLLGLLISRR